ncbi:MAG: hypothetical protein OXH22_12430 [Chloroflexi bacterium]|nr:hypothetical protein [Chloroflexota bacterium]
MGCFNVKMDIGDQHGERWITTDALVDTGAFFSSIPPSTLRELGVSPVMSRNFQFGDGSIKRMNIGRTWIRVNGRDAFTQVTFSEEGAPILLGALALEELLFVVNPKEQRLVPMDLINA